jgi:uncharacterized paraquat-inducible protein A
MCREEKTDTAWLTDLLVVPKRKKQNDEEEQKACCLCHDRDREKQEQTNECYRVLLRK